MSEYIIGDRIEAAEQPYTLTAADLEAVGIRVYGAAGAQTLEDTTGRYWTVMIKNDYHADVLLASVGNTAVAEGAYADVYRGSYQAHHPYQILMMTSLLQTSLRTHRRANG